MLYMEIKPCKKRLALLQKCKLNGCELILVGII